MSAYETLRQTSRERKALHRLPDLDDARPSYAPGCGNPARQERDGHAAVLDLLVEEIVKRVADALAARIDTNGQVLAEWLDSCAAAAYLGLHRDTLRKLAAERTIPFHQDAPGCKLFFRRADLDEWRCAGGRAVQRSSLLAAAA